MLCCLMKLYFFICFLFFPLTAVFAQKYSQPIPKRHKCGTFHHENERRQKMVDTLYKITGIQLTEHPTVWLIKKMEAGTYTIDTTINPSDSSTTYNYYDEAGKPFMRTMNSSKKDFNYIITTLYNENGMEIFNEGVSCTQSNIRIRTIYDEDNRPVIRCTHISSAGIERTDILQKKKQFSIFTDCKCDF